jgi:hypothetical protein
MLIRGRSDRLIERSPSAPHDFDRFARRGEHGMVAKVARCPTTLWLTRLDQRKSSSAARPTMEQTWQKSLAMVVSGSTGSPSTAAPAMAAAKSTTSLPAPKGLGVERSSRRRRLHEPGTGSRINSSSLGPDRRGSR